MSRIGRCCPVPPGGLFVQSQLGKETETRGSDVIFYLTRLYLSSVSHQTQKKGNPASGLTFLEKASIPGRCPSAGSTQRTWKGLA